jgi:hypothetical protein
MNLKSFLAPTKYDVPILGLIGWRAHEALAETQAPAWAIAQALWIWLLYCGLRLAVDVVADKLKTKKS